MFKKVQESPGKVLEFHIQLQWQPCIMHQSLFSSLNIVEHTLISVVLSIGYFQIKFEPRNAGVYSAQIQVFPSPVVPEAQTGTKLTEPSVPCLVSMEIVAEEPKVEVRTCLHR